MDDLEGENIGSRGSHSVDNRCEAPEYVSRYSAYYNMNHEHRGICLVFSYRSFLPQCKLEDRKCSETDTAKCRDAFRSLDFEVKEFCGLTKKEILTVIKDASREDHSNRDCLVLVFMSHGMADEVTNKELLWTYDATIAPSELWIHFAANNCPTLAGKPKLFFIQACRGTKTDKGVRIMKPRGLRVETDGVAASDSYSVPSHSDTLVMWASYPGYFAFKSNNRDINGSVFIHFLTKVLKENGFKDDLSVLLLTVTRYVALMYESFVPKDEDLHENKQIPYTESTLMRKLIFKPKKLGNN